MNQNLQGHADFSTGKFDQACLFNQDSIWNMEITFGKLETLTLQLCK